VIKDNGEDLQEDLSKSEDEKESSILNFFLKVSYFSHGRYRLPAC